MTLDFGLNLDQRGKLNILTPEGEIACSLGNQEGSFLRRIQHCSLAPPDFFLRWVYFIHMKIAILSALEKIKY